MPTTVLSNLERRAVGNLSIPRNVADLTHVLRQDPHAPTLTEKATATLLTELAGVGLVVNVGEHTDLSKLAAGIEKHKTAVTMPDEKARIYVERVQHRDRAWRATGDLWHFTEAGLAMLVAEDPDAKVSETWEVEALIAAEYARLAETDLVGSIFDLEQVSGDGLGGGRLTRDVALHNALLSEELAHWVQLVSDEHFERTGERPRVPLAGGAGYGDATELLILAADTGGTAYGETSPTFAALTTVAVTDADTGSTITRATYTGYADKSVANTDFNAAAAGAHTNLNAITWAGATALTSTVIGVARVTTSGGGRLIRYGTCASTVVSATNTPASIAAGAYSDTLD